MAEELKEVMKFDKSLSIIKNTPMPIFQSGYAEDIKTFWADFVVPRLPKKEIVLAWHELLVRYIQEEDAVFVIRAFYNTNKKSRRGLLTKTNQNFLFTYSDNGFSKLIAKMVLCGFCPEYEEFKDAMLRGKMPISEFSSTQETKSFFQYLKLDFSAYKLAHIVDFGKNLYINEHEMGITEICATYFPAGELSDWKQEGDYFIRNLTVPNETKDIITALFLRYADPLNYFLTPKPQSNGVSFHRTEITLPKNDIAEYEPLQMYAMQYFSERYGKVYTDFLKYLKLSPRYDKYKTDNAFANSIIKIHYEKSANSKQKPVTKTIPTERNSTCSFSRKTETSQISVIPEKVLIIKTKQEKIDERGGLYDATHKWWPFKIGRARLADYAFAVIREKGDIIQEVYRINHFKWHQEQNGDKREKDIRWVFEGELAEEEIRKKYVGKKLPDKFCSKSGMIGSYFYTYD